MTSDACDINQAMAALSYLRHSFGGFPIPETEERSHLRTFRRYTPAEVADAIESLKGRDRRPSPSDVEAAIKLGRKSGRRYGGPYLDTTVPTVTTVPDDVRAAIGAGREAFQRRRVDSATTAEEQR